MPPKIKIFPILDYKNPKLRLISKELDKKVFNDPEFQNLCLSLAETMLKKDGVGLAAPQIGKNIRLIAINTKDGILCLANPRISKKSWAKKWEEEGCLSVPNVYGKVKRHVKISCLYLNRQGKKMKMEAQGLMARVLQHEIDHLDGILFIDKAKNLNEIINE